MAVRFDQSSRSGIASASSTALPPCARPIAVPGSFQRTSFPRDHRGDGCFDATRGRLRSLVFPYAVNLPTGRREHTVVASVTFDVGCELLSPPAGVRGGLRAMSRAAVPEAAVNENGDSRAYEDDVGSTPYAGYGRVVDAVAQSALVQLSAKRQLGLRVAPTVGAHRGAGGRRGRRRRGGTGHERIIFHSGTLTPWSASAHSRTVPDGCP